jgi:UDP-N-acetylmuramyl pentapeptide phosphotransferase/UDP-N-acetylglucosamine-1-phosphate transferase
MEQIQKPKCSQRIFYSILWGVTYLACAFIIKHYHPSTPTGIILSFIPTITFALFIFNYIKNINAMDEVERRVQLEAVVWAFSLGLLLLMTLGLLDLVVTLKKEDWGNITFVIPCFFAFYFIGILISRRKYN